MREMLDKIQKKYDLKCKEVESVELAHGSTRNELAQTKKKLQKVENELLELKTKWDKFQKMFSKIK